MALTNNIVVLKNISKYYADSQQNFKTLFFNSRNKRNYALKNINLTFLKGEVVGIIGSNGSGKSTLLQIISGILKPNSGSVSYNCKNISSIIELGSGFDSELSVKDNLNLYLYTIGYSKKEITQKISEILEFAELKKVLNFKLKTLSSGMKARIFFSSSIIYDAELYVIDEALTTGDAYFVDKCIGKVKELCNSKKSIIVVSHSIDMIREVSDKVVWIEKGKIAKIGNPLKICNDYDNFVKKRREIFLKSNTQKKTHINVKIFNNKKKESFSYNQGERINLEINCNLKISDKSQYALTIFNKNNICVTGWNSSEYNIYLKKDSNLKKVKISFDNVLGEGEYSINFLVTKLTFHKNENDFLYKFNDILKFHSYRVATSKKTYYFEVKADIEHELT